MDKSEQDIVHSRNFLLNILPAMERSRVHGIYDGIRLLASMIAVLFHRLIKGIIRVLATFEVSPNFALTGTATIGYCD